MIRQTDWHNFSALSLESDLLRVVIVPSLGAKIVSFFDRVHNHEWLVPPMRPLKQVEYGAKFVDQDMSGWDEMLPTIDACVYNGVELPDHGEVWSIPWQTVKADEEAVLSVKGLALPYQLRRAASLIAPNCLELRYMLTNLGDEPFQYLWAAHPQFNADAHTRIILPAEVTQVVYIVAGEPWGNTGDTYSWPEARSPAGEIYALDKVRPATTHDCRKFYTLPEQGISWAGLRHEPSGREIRLEWSAEELPYFGLWVDEGTFNQFPVAALEPSNGYYDSLERAITNNRVSALAPGENVHWKLRLSLNAAAVLK